MTSLPTAVAGRAREVVAKVLPGVTTARRSLPIRAGADDIRRRWAADADGRTAVLEGIPAADADLQFGGQDGTWGTTVTLTLRLEESLPRPAAQALAGKAVRRLKALVEVGEVPTTAHNPSGRADAAEAPA